MKCEYCGHEEEYVEVWILESIYNKLKQLECELFNPNQSDIDSFSEMVLSDFIQTCDMMKKLNSYHEFKKHLIENAGIYISKLRPEWMKEFEKEERIIEHY